MTNKIRDTPEIFVPEGYDLNDIIDTDGDGYFDEAPIYTEEVTVKYGRNGGK